MANNQDTETHSEISEFKSSREHRYLKIYDYQVDNPSIPGYEIQCAMSQETRGAEPTMASVMQMMLQMMEKTETQWQRDEERWRQEFQLMLKMTTEKAQKRDGDRDRELEKILVETKKQETESRERLEKFHNDMEKKHLAER